MNQACGQVQVFGGARTHGCKIQVAVRDMYGQHAAHVQMAHIQREGLAREQMDRNGIAREGVDREHIETLRRLGFERQACIAEFHRNVRAAFGGEREIGELRVREIHDIRVDLVDAELIVRTCIAEQRADPQPHDAHAHRSCGLLGQDGSRHA